MTIRYVAVMEFGSSKITAIIGAKGVNGTFNIRGYGECEYEGFASEVTGAGGIITGEFYDPSYVKTAAKHALSMAEDNAHLSIDKLYVGVPGAFCSLQVKNAAITLGKKRRIGSIDVENLIAQGSAALGTDKIGRSIISAQPLHFVLDDNRRVFSALGEYSNRLSAPVSFIMADNTFTNYISGMARDIGVYKVEYLSSVLSGYRYLFSGKQREGYNILVDIGLISTTVSLTRDNGLVGLKSLEMGGGHITGALFTDFEMDDTSYKLAELLKRKVALTLNASDIDTYSVLYKSETFEYNALKAGKTVESCVKEMAYTIKEAISGFETEIPDYTVCHVTGGGISYIRGVREVLSKIIGRRVEIIKPQIPRLNKPELSAELGLLAAAIADNEAIVAQNSVVSRLISKLSFLTRR